MKLGTVVKFSDGRIATVCYNGLDGIGFKEGDHKISVEDLKIFRQTCPIFEHIPSIPQEFIDKWTPDFITNNYDCEIIRDGIKIKTERMK